MATRCDECKWLMVWYEHHGEGLNELMSECVNDDITEEELDAIDQAPAEEKNCKYYKPIQPKVELGCGTGGERL